MVEVEAVWKVNIYLANALYQLYLFDFGYVFGIDRLEHIFLKFLDNEKYSFFFRWVNTDSTSSFSSDDRTVVRVGSTAVCRGWYQNQQVAGGTDPKGRCSVTFFETRQLMENVTNKMLPHLQFRFKQNFMVFHKTHCHLQKHFPQCV